MTLFLAYRILLLLDSISCELNPIIFVETGRGCEAIGQEWPARQQRISC